MSVLCFSAKYFVDSLRLDMFERGASNLASYLLNKQQNKIKQNNEQPTKVVVQSEDI